MGRKVRNLAEKHIRVEILQVPEIGPYVSPTGEHLCVALFPVAIARLRRVEKGRNTEFKNGEFQVSANGLDFLWQKHNDKPRSGQTTKR